jgi:dephospho-CoA kinase
VSLPALQARWRRLTPEQRLYGRDYPVVALTGGIGSGKSTVGKFLAQKGVPYVSADALVKWIYAREESRTWLARHYPEVVNPDTGMADFRRLRARAFADPAVRLDLEAWVYPRLPDAFAAAEKSLRPVPWLVYEIPLLFERQMETLFDAVVVSWVPAAVQRERVLRRDQSDPAVVDAIIAQQLPIDEKRARADLVFDNSFERSEIETMVALEALWAELVAHP